MSTPRLSLDVLNVPNPCAVPWKSMAGSNQVRFCTQCQMSVYNLSAMTSVEANAVLNSIESPCVRFFRRLDGTVVTTERCGGKVARSWRRFTAATVAMFVTLASLVGCDGSSFGICTQGKKVAPPGPTTGTPTTTTKSETDK